MKKYAFIISVVCIQSALNAQDGGAKPVFRDVATHEQLVEKFQKAEQKDPMKELELSEGTDPSIQNQPLNLIDSSDLISFNGLTTLVPKRAIMQLPEVYKERINNHIEGNRVVGWIDFYSANRGWITLVEITRAQAGGDEDLDEALVKQLSKSKNMIVCVLDSGPISYMPYRGEEEEKKESE